MTIDALRYAKRLEATGVPRPQSEAQAEALRDELATNLVTHADLGTMVDRIDARFDLVETRLNARIDALDAKFDSKIDKAIARLEATMLRQNVALLLAVLAVGRFLVRFLR